MVKVGDTIPNVELHKKNPMDKVMLGPLIEKGKTVLVGVPGAFSPDCSDTHVPSYLLHPDIKKNNVIVVSVVDAFVMNAWGKKLDPNGDSGITFLADPHAELASKLELLGDYEQYFGNKRYMRSAIQIQDGKVTNVEIEPDPSKLSKTGAEDNL